MTKEKFKPYLKWAIYYIALIVLYAFQTTPHLFEIFSVKPVLIVSLAICISMFESVMPSAIFSMIAGLLWDMSSDKLMGFNGIIIMMCGVFISLFCVYYLHTKLINSIVFCTIVMTLQGLLDYFLYYAIWNYSNTYIILVNEILPTILYTVISIIPLFFMIRSISYKFNTIARV